MVTLSEILTLFPYANPTQNGYNVKCPLHEDDKGSLSVALKKNNKGYDQIFFHCQAGCLGKNGTPNKAAFNQLLAKLGYSVWDLTDQPKPASNGTNGNHQNGTAKYARLLEDIVAVYDYKDETGKLLYQCVKYDMEAQKTKGRDEIKARMRQPGNAPGYYKWNMNGARWTLYRLSELLAVLS